VRTHTLADFDDVNRIVVALALGVLVDVVGSLPGLGERAVVPDVSVVGEAVVDEASLALLLVLDDRVERQVLADLCCR